MRLSEIGTFVVLFVHLLCCFRFCEVLKEGNYFFVSDNFYLGNQKINSAVQS